MKKLINFGYATVLFALILLLAFLSAPTVFADSDPAAFRVTVPTCLPVVVGPDGSVSVAGDAQIVNDSAFPVLLDSVSVVPQNSWRLDPWGTNYSTTPVGSKRFAMQFGGVGVPTDGSIDVSGCGPIGAGGSMSLSYDAQVATQSANLNETIANVVFTLTWSGRGPLMRLAVATRPAITEYRTGDAFKTAGMRIGGVYGNGKGYIVSGWTVLNGTPLAEGQTSVTVSYTESGITKTVDVPITVSPPAYAILYDNGELVFQSGSAPESGRTVLGTYTGFETQNYTSGSRAPWYSQRTAISKVTFKDRIRPNSAAYWFNQCSNLTALSGAGNLDLSAATSTAYMFNNCSSLFSVSLSDWDTSNIRTMNSMFSGCTSLAVADLAGWDTGKVTSMSAMFLGDTALTGVGLSAWNTANVRDFSSMFYRCTNLSSLDLSRWDTGSATSMKNMFYFCNSLTSLDLNGWDTSNVTNMEGMFCQSATDGSLASLKIAAWDTSKVENMNSMFRGCGSLRNLNLSSWDTSAATGMHGMFYYCSGLVSLNLSGWDTSGVTDMGSMFCNCDSLASLDVSAFDTGAVTNMRDMFSDCDSLATIYASSGFVTGSVTDGANMFYYSWSLVGGNGTAYSAQHVDYDYARIDRADAKGYFTAKAAGALSAANVAAIMDIAETPEIAEPDAADAAETDAADPVEAEESEEVTEPENPGMEQADAPEEPEPDLEPFSEPEEDTSEEETIEETREE